MPAALSVRVRRMRNTERGAASALVQLARSLGPDWETSIRRIVAFDAQQLHVERVSFWSMRAESASLHLESGYVASLKSFEHGATLIEPDLPEFFAALREARVVDVRDVRTDPRCRGPGLRDYCAERRIASMLDVPVWVEGQLAGVLCHEHVGRPRHWSAREQDFATSVSQVVSSALIARAHSQAEAAARRAAFLDSLSRSLFSLDPQVVVRGLLSVCVPAVADCMLVWLLNRKGVLECAGVRHADPRLEQVAVLHAREREESGRTDIGTVGYAMRRNQSVLVPKVTPTLMTRYGVTREDIARLRGMGLRSVLSVPIALGGARPFGVVTFVATCRHYDTDDLELGEAIVSRLASSLEHARLYGVSQEAIRARDELLELASHELRTPLTALRLATDRLVRTTRRRGHAGDVEQCEKIAKHVGRFCALVEHILVALRIRSEGVTLERARCDLAEVVRGRVEHAAPRAQADGSRIALDGPESVLACLDRRCIENAIDALLDNAVKFGKGKPIAVSLRVEGAWAALTVHDEGPGIPAERLPGLFGPFERAVPKQHFGGLGLGLYTAKAVVEAHGGSIDATSAPGEGTTFVVRLPLAGERGAAPQTL